LGVSAWEHDVYDEFHDQVNQERRAVGLSVLSRKQTRTMWNQAYPGDVVGDSSTATLLNLLDQRGVRGDAAERVIFAAVDGLPLQQASGSAAGLPIINERASLQMVNQELPMSCAAACGRQLLRDIGVDVAEAKVRTLARTSTFGTETHLGHLADALNQLDSRGSQVRWEGRAVPEPEAQMHAAALRLSQNGPWVADMTFWNGSDVAIHSIIVDAVVGNVVRVRDPWGWQGPGLSGSGTEGVMYLGDFLRRWSMIGTHRVQ
jgi:hypothetical protein